MTLGATVNQRRALQAICSENQWRSMRVDSLRPMRFETGFRTPEKRRSRLNVLRTRRGVVSFAWGPHPHALSQAFASFFQRHDGVLHTVSPRTGRIEFQLARRSRRED